MSFNNQLTKPKTIALSTRLDAKTLASLDHYWRKNGNSPRSTSELVRVSLEYFAEILQSKELTKFFPTQEEALIYLSKTPLTFQLQPTKMHSQLIHEDSSEISSELLRKHELEMKLKDVPPDLSLPNSHPIIQDAATLLQHNLNKMRQEQIENETPDPTTIDE
jgi:hypothetical protein